MVARYRANHANINQLLEGRTGPVTLFVANKGREAAGHAGRLVGVKTGDLKTTIGSRVVKSTSGYNAEVFAGGTPKTAQYVLPHHSGAKPHIIRPKRKRALKFQVGGKTVFATKVNHPGNKGTFFLLRGGQMAGLRVRRR